MSSAISADPDKPEFISPSRNGFYKLPTGAQSNYGDQMMVTMRSLAHSKGIVVIELGLSPKSGVISLNQE